MNKTEIIHTLIVLSLVSIVFYIIFKASWLIYLSAFLLLLGLFDNPIATIIAKSWMKFALIIGNLNSKIILGFVFFIFLTPIAFLFRIFNKDLLFHFKSKKEESYFVDINTEYNKELFERPW